jgi:xanthosine utilization system XapX-like protein
MSNDQSQPFSTAWMIASVLIFTAMEILIAIVIAPAIFAGRLASPMLQMRLEMLMHLGSFLVGGLFVGIISPRVRMMEPAVGAIIAVALVFLMSVFMPHSFMHWSWTKIAVGGGIAFALALSGAYTGEKWMGNVSEPGTRRADFRDKMWGDHGLLSRGDTSFLASSSESSSSRTRR